MGVDLNGPTPAPRNPSGASDVLLWLGGAIVAVIGATWLFLARPWVDTGSAVPVVTTPTVPAREPRTVREAAIDEQTALDDGLRMAELAHAAGMLLEPEGFGAWTLYERVLAEAPDHQRARAGLAAVADALIERARTALAQGREHDTEDLLARVLERLPEHTAARRLQQDLAERARRAAEPAAAPAPGSPATPAASPLPEPDPLLALRADFDRSLLEDRLLAPAGDNAKLHVDRMRAADPDHPATRAAASALSARLLAQAASAIEGLDVQAANTWIAAAATIALDPAGVESARAALRARVIAAETSRLLPASELVLLEYVPPVYPVRALNRSAEGWVDVEFLVGRDGGTRDIIVTAASDDRLFADAAVAAVAQWQFEPRVVMDETVEQRSFARIRFELQ